MNKIIGYKVITDFNDFVKPGDKYKDKNYPNQNWINAYSRNIGDKMTFLSYCGNEEVFKHHIFRRPIYKKKIG